MFLEKISYRVKSYTKIKLYSTLPFNDRTCCFGRPHFSVIYWNQQKLIIFYRPVEERKETMKTAIYHSPFGQMELSYEEGRVISLRMAEEGTKGEAPFGLALTVFRELDEYFQGRRKTFDFPCHTHGTAFQEKVWAALREIPYGETRSYRDIAEAIGHPKAYRAVGMASNANPFFIIIPCHRVIGADGSLTGYGGGLPMKKALLMLEKKHSIS